MKIEDQKEQKHSAWKGFLAFCLIGIFITIGIICFNNCSGKDGNPLTRDATINDLNIDTSEEISLSMNYKMIPKADINNLELTFKYYNGNNTLVTTIVKDVGNVKEGNQYTISISFGNFSLTNLLTIESVKVQVTEGSISYF